MSRVELDFPDVKSEENQSDTKSEDKELDQQALERQRARNSRRLAPVVIAGAATAIWSAAAAYYIFIAHRRWRIFQPNGSRKSCCRIQHPSRDILAGGTGLSANRPFAGKTTGHLSKPGQGRGPCGSC